MAGDNRPCFPAKNLILGRKLASLRHCIGSLMTIETNRWRLNFVKMTLAAKAKNVKVEMVSSTAIWKEH
jgi:hypothetical protein